MGVMEVPWSTRRPPTLSLLTAMLACGIATVAAVLFVDEPIARALAPYEPLAVWDIGVLILEWAILLPLDKHALPVLLVVAMLAAVSVKKWRGAAPALMTITAVHLLGRLVTNWIKDGTGRFRPLELLKRDIDGTSFGWEGGVAFPSGHVVLFASLVIPILYAVPRTRTFAIPLLAIVAFIAAARIGVNAHWLSDTLGALTLTIGLTYAVAWAVRPSR